MKKMELRPYQEEARRAVEDQWLAGTRRTLLVLPTGTGKTIVFAKITEDMVRKGNHVLILAHRGELLEQAADKIKKATGLGCSVEKAEETCIGQWYQVTVGSVQSLQRPKRLEKFSQDYFDTIIIDEAHHAISPGYQHPEHRRECYRYRLQDAALQSDRPDNKPQSSVYCQRCDS